MGRNGDFEDLGEIWIAKEYAVIPHCVVTLPTSLLLCLVISFRHNRTTSFVFWLYVECGYNLYSEVRSGGWSREERFGDGGNGKKKVFYIFFKKMRKSVAFYIFLWYYVSEEAYRRRILPSRQRTAEVGH